MKQASIAIAMASCVRALVYLARHARLSCSHGYGVADLGTGQGKSVRVYRSYIHWKRKDGCCTEDLICSEWCIPSPRAGHVCSLAKGF